MGTEMEISGGFQVWIEDPNVVWIDGEVLEIKGKKVNVRTSDGRTVKVNLSNVFPKDIDALPRGMDNMTKLPYLHEPGVLHNLATRYELDEIYTYAGNILIAINPYKKLPHLDDMQRYKGVPFGEQSPHVFAVADAAYRDMIKEGKNQSILVSGESGAGKTESTKMVMRYLAHIGGRAPTNGRKIEQRVIESNPLLEAFGNAKTVRNNNSSRFSKYVELQFNKDGRVSGAAVKTYLLEISRVCRIPDLERNYHCFYSLCAAPQEVIEKYKLEPPSTFNYLNQSTCYELDGVSDAEEYVATRRAMEVVGITPKEQDTIFRLLAGILHLGNVNFEGRNKGSSKIGDEKSKFHSKMAAKLFMCDAYRLEESLCMHKFVEGNAIYTQARDPKDSIASRDALARAVYARLFNWLVSKVNNSIGWDPDSKNFIGVLDISGFECFNTNSFEQFCINHTNEKLQQLINQHVFKMEKDEYAKEEIDTDDIEFVDNQDVLHLYEKNSRGLFDILDSICEKRGLTHKDFLEQIQQHNRRSKRFYSPKYSRDEFTITHYAGDVTYESDLFVEKNKDYVIAQHRSLLCSSDCSFLAGLFPPAPVKSFDMANKFSSVGAQYRQQLQSLFDILKLTKAHFIRCVKPNSLLKPKMFDNQNILNQLRYTGVVESIRTICAGYPTRLTFDEFLNQFSILAPNVLDPNYDEKMTSEMILQKIDLQGYKIGKTKVFLKAGQIAELHARRSEILGKAEKIIESKLRSFIPRRKYLNSQKTTIREQVLWRANAPLEVYKNMRSDDVTMLM